MKTLWLSGAAAIALMAGAALAQTSVGTTVTTTTVAPPGVLPPPAVTAPLPLVPPASAQTTTRTERTIDALGNQTETKQSYSSGGGGAASRSETQVRRWDGSTESSSSVQWSNQIPAVSVVPPSTTTFNADGSVTTTTRSVTTTR